MNIICLQVTVVTETTATVPTADKTTEEETPVAACCWLSSLGSGCHLLLLAAWLAVFWLSSLASDSYILRLAVAVDCWLSLIAVAAGCCRVSSFVRCAQAGFTRVATSVPAMFRSLGPGCAAEVSSHLPPHVLPV